jgi:nicotinamidase-related amidase
MLFTLGDAVFRGYHPVLMRDCTLATELPDEVEELAHTQRMILWMESFLGASATSKDFVAAVEPMVIKTKN